MITEEVPASSGPCLDRDGFTALLIKFDESLRGCSQPETAARAGRSGHRGELVTAETVGESGIVRVMDRFPSIEATQTPIRGEPNGAFRILREIPHLIRLQGLLGRGGEGREADPARPR